MNTMNTMNSMNAMNTMNAMNAMNAIKEYTHEELYRLANKGSEEALMTLCTDYKALFLSASEPYRNRMEAMGTEDFIQEGWICVWKVCSKGNFEPGTGSFGGYLKQAVKFHYAGLWQKYTQKNLVCQHEAVHTAGAEDAFIRSFGTGYSDRYYGVDRKAEKYREQQKERNRRCADRKAAERDRMRAEQGLPPVWRPSRATEEEKEAHAEEMRARRNARAKAYQEAHKEEIRERKSRYYMANRRRYRVTDGIRRTKASIAKFEAEGNEKRAAKARERLAEYEAEYAEIKKASRK